MTIIDQIIEDCCDTEEQRAWWIALRDNLQVLVDDMNFPQASIDACHKITQSAMRASAKALAFP